MTIRNPFSAGNGVSTTAGLSPAQVVRQTQAAVNAALDSLADGVQTLRTDAGELGQAAQDHALDGLDAVRHGSQALLRRAQVGTVQVQRQIRQDPLKSILIAAASGAALATLVGLLVRSRRHD